MATQTVAQNPPAAPVAAAETAASAVLALADQAARETVSVQFVYDTVLSGRSPNTIHEYGHTYQDFAAFLRADESIAPLLRGMPGWAALQADGRPSAAMRFLTSLQAGQANALAAAYRSHLVGRGLKPNTVNARLGALRSFVAEARRFGLIAWSLDVRNERARAYRDTAGPGRDAYVAMLAHCAARADAKGRRDLAVLRLLHDLGLRRTEVARLDAADVDFARGTLRVVGKGHRDPLLLSPPAPVIDALRGWFEARGGAAGPLFVNLDPAAQNDASGRRLSDHAVWSIVKEAGEAVGARARPHGLRHTAITEVARRSGGNLPMTAAFARHENWNTTRIYVDNARELGAMGAKLIAE